MYLIKEDLYELFRFVSRNVAKSVGVHDTDFKSAYEMMQEIEIIDKNIHEKVNGFFEAYQEWYKYCLMLESEGKYDNLTSDEQDKLKQLENNRDETRTILIQNIKKP